MIRKAIVGDMKQIHKLLNYYGDRGLLLARPLSELYDHLRDFMVLVEEREEDRIIGTCALGICWEDLAEIRSLAVAKEYQGKRIGTLLVENCLEEARTFGLKRVFTLSYVPEFFSKLGFSKVDKAVLPHKVWADCIRCSKFPDCDEIAMIMEL